MCTCLRACVRVCVCLCMHVCMWPIETRAVEESVFPVLLRVNLIYYSIPIMWYIHDEIYENNDKCTVKLK